ncbi:MAG TPA: N-acetylmuramoyl-L-alanine amidase [Parvibaculum sp.]
MDNKSIKAGLDRSPLLGVVLAVAVVVLSAWPVGADPQAQTLGTLPVARPSPPSVTETGSIDQASLPEPSDADAVSEEPASTPSTGVAPSAPANAGTAAVTGIRLGDRGAETRFVVELGGADAVKYHIFTLADPYRVVVDLHNLASRLPDDNSLKGRGLIADYRYGQFQENTFRIVIETTGPVAVSRNFVLDPQGGFGRRVVIDLAATDRPAFLASVGLPANDQAAVQAQAQPAAQPVIAPTPPAAHDRRRVVVIDPGHGGVDPGTHGRSSGVVEKDVVLAFGRALAKRLRDTGRYDVYMTRDKDIFIPLRERVEIARAHKADLFISIHADSISKPDVRGMSVYTLSETASDKEAAALARKENLSDAIAGIDFKGESPEVTGILIDLAQRETKNYSSRFAKSLVDYARQSTTLLDPTHRFAGFVVLKAPDVPSVLVELGFLTNGNDEKRLTSPKWRSAVTASFVKAVDRYFGDRLAEGPN